MNTHENTEAKPRARRWVIGALLAVASAAAGLGIANGAPSLHGQHVHMTMSPEAMDAHIDKMVEQCAANASPDQKMRLAAIAKALVTDLRPVHRQFAAEHARAHTLLMAPVIDRAALEQWRAAQMQRMDAMSRRLAVAVEDGAEVLTPEQRAACGDRLRTLMH